MTDLDIVEYINPTCPWSRKRARAGSLTQCDGHVVGACNTGSRDKFDAAIRQFQDATAARAPR